MNTESQYAPRMSPSHECKTMCSADIKRTEKEDIVRRLESILNFEKDMNVRLKDLHMTLGISFEDYELEPMPSPDGLFPAISQMISIIGTLQSSNSTLINNIRNF